MGGFACFVEVPDGFGVQLGSDTFRSPFVVHWGVHIQGSCDFFPVVGVRLLLMPPPLLIVFTESGSLLQTLKIQAEVTGRGANTLCPIFVAVKKKKVCTIFRRV